VALAATVVVNQRLDERSSVNIATRLPLPAGSIAFAGFVHQRQRSRRPCMLRAVGPGLTQASASANAMADPMHRALLRR
jgi:hypothetical protein